jgi:RNA polymerase sigma-70 factor (ECF subfamily)
MTGVSFIDRHGVALFRHLSDHNVTVLHCSPFVAEQLKGGGALRAICAAGSLSQAEDKYCAGRRPVDVPLARPGTEEKHEAVLRTHDQTACAHLIWASSTQMVAVAWRLLRHEADALDAVQEAGLAVFQTHGDGEDGPPLVTRLHRLVIAKALVKWRTRQRQGEEPIDALLPPFSADGRHAHAVVAWPETGEEAWHHQTTHTIVRSCLDRLPESYRMVLLLRDVEELPPEEIAPLLGVSPSAVQVRLHHARQALQTLLNPHFQSGAI